jgi:hypothetical protein
MRDPRLLIVAGVAVLAIVLFAILRPGGSDSSSSSTQPQPPPPASTGGTTPPPAPTQTTPKPTTIRIVVRGGKPTGGIERVTVDKGTRVVLAVSSDVADEVHLHGYNKMVDVAPGKPARLAFTASLPGVFEVELENRTIQLAEITVNP